LYPRLFVGLGRRVRNGAGATWYCPIAIAALERNELQTITAGAFRPLAATVLAGAQAAGRHECDGSP